MALQIPGFKNILNACLIVILFLPILFAAPAEGAVHCLICNETNPIPARTIDEESLLQFTSGGHVLEFSPDGVIIASTDHMLKTKFIGSNSSIPEADAVTPAENSAGKASPLGRVTYHSVWDGVTVVYESRPGAIVESTYYLNATEEGMPVERIRLGYNHPLSVDGGGNLVIAYESGTMSESAPVAWQEIDGQRKPVDVAYQLYGQNEVGFSLGDYLPGIQVIIDPRIVWNSFLGASAVGYSIAVDVSGNVYVTGFSDKTWGNPVRPFSSTRNAFVAKVNSSGNLAWNTFLGGGADFGEGIAVDGSGNVYVTGVSGTTWGSPVRAFSSAPNGNAFAAKLDSNGNLTWNTFLGPSAYYMVSGITADESGNVYVTGTSTAAWGSPVRAFTGGADAFAAKLNSTGNVTWNTFLGGSGNNDEGHAIEVDGGGNVYVAGSSWTTWGSPVRAYSSGGDAFAAKLNNSGTITWNTFLGGSGENSGFGIDVDSNSNVYVSGSSSGAWGNPVRAYTAGEDAYAAKLNSGGNLIWNTFLGGNGNDQGWGTAVDGSGNVYVAGKSNTTWGNPVRAYIAGGNNEDGFATGLDSSGNLTWIDFLGGNGDDFGSGIAADRSGDVYVTGYSTAAWGSPVRSFGANDAFVSKISPSLNPAIPQLATLNATLVDSDNETVHATLNGNLISLDGATSENVSFEYWQRGTTERKTAPNPPTTMLTSPGAFSTTVHGLAGNKYYVFRAVGYANDYGTIVTTYGENITFRAVPEWRKDIQPGDILITYPSDPHKQLNSPVVKNLFRHSINNVLKWYFPNATNNPTFYMRHTGIYVGENITTGQGQVIEACDDGVDRTDIWMWDSANKKQVRLLGVNTTDPTKFIAAEFAQSQLGKPYNYPAFDYTGKSFTRDARLWYCSELCWAAYYNSNGTNIGRSTGSGDPEGIIRLNPLNDFAAQLKWAGIIAYKNSIGEPLPNFPLIAGIYSPVWDRPVFPSHIEASAKVYEKGKHIVGDIITTGETIVVLSPIDIIVTTPDGHIVRKGYTDIPGASYVEGDYYGDGQLEDIIYIPTQVNGNYHISVVPHTGASANDTYSILFIGNQEDGGIPVALGTPVSDIPQQGYNIQVGDINIRSASAYTTLGVVTFNINAGSISGLEAISTAAMRCGANGYAFPYGMFSYNITNLTPGQSVSVAIRLPNPMPLGTKYFKCQNGNLVDCSSVISRPDTNTIVLTLKDGGIGDADGMANGTIVDPGGPAFPLDAPASHGSFMPPTPQAPVSLPGISVKSASLSTFKVKPGKPFIVTAIVTSPVNDTTRIKLYINNQEESSQLVTANQGKEVPINFTISKNEPGTYAVYVESVNAGSITVGEVDEHAGPNIILYIVIALIIFAIILRAIYVWRKLNYRY